MKRIDNWPDAARQLNEDTRALSAGVKDAFAAVQEALVAMNAALLEAHERISKLEDAARAAADTDWAFPVGARVTADEGPDRQIMEVTDRYYDGDTRMYVLDGWLCISDGVIGKQGWETA